MDTQDSRTAPSTLTCPVRSIVRSPKRLALACIGLTSTGLGAVGAVVPGLPTTVFVIIAAWCFAKSCPWLEEILLRNRLFGPAMTIIDGTRPFTNIMRCIAATLMWIFGLTSAVFILHRANAGLIAPTSIVAALVIGTFFIAMYKQGEPLSTESSISIGGMSCGKCVTHVRHVLADVTGIRTKQVEIGKAVIIHRESSALQSAINAVRAAGFEAEVHASTS